MSDIKLLKNVASDLAIIHQRMSTEILQLQRWRYPTVNLEDAIFLIDNLIKRIQTFSESSDSNADDGDSSSQTKQTKP